MSTHADPTEHHAGQGTLAQSHRHSRSESGPGPGPEPAGLVAMLLVSSGCRRAAGWLGLGATTRIRLGLAGRVLILFELGECPVVIARDFTLKLTRTRVHTRTII